MLDRSRAPELFSAAGSRAPGAGLADPMLPRPYRVRKVVKETYDTFTLELEPAQGEDRYEFAPGQFNMLYLFGLGEVPISISGDAAEPATLVHTLRAVGAVTDGLCHLSRDAEVGVRGPFGTAWPVGAAEGSDVVVVAGGIGLAPLRPAVYHLLAHRERYGRIVIFYGARSPRDLLYRRELERWRSRFDLAVEPTVDYAAESWRGHVGVVTKLIARGGFDPTHATALVCGPEIMMRFAVRELLKRGVPREQVYLSMERNMKCAVGSCGHCQLGPSFICKDGPVFRLPQIEPFFDLREV